MESSLIIIILIIIAIVLISTRQHSPVDNGEALELSVASIAMREFRKGLYGHVLHNVYIPRKDGSTSEADVILVSTKGIFVFECKNYAGWIFGSDQNKTWTVTLYAGKDWLGFKHTEKHQFYNPVWQNRTHINALHNLLEVPAPYYSVIVFSNRGELKDVNCNSNDVLILQTNQLKRYLSVVRTTYPDVLSVTEVDSITNKLSQYASSDEEAKQAHLNSLRERYSSTETCPWCGGKLVMRTAKKGQNAGRQFYGCSNYPKCKYTKNLN